MVTCGQYDRVLLATLLVWPQAGDWFGELSYGRWMPLHLDWQLYGWCSLPLVGMLMAWCLVADHPGVVRHARVALAAWTLALALGGLAWLSGVTSGKLFLDWYGWTRPLLPLAMVVLWTVLAAHGLFWRKLSPARVVVLAGLLAVPSALYWAAGRNVYPSVNPDSGGATGASLLGSTLGIVLVFGMLPEMVGVVRRPGWRGVGPPGFWWAMAASFAVFAVIDHGNASHHAVGQIAGLGLLLGWVPLAWSYFRGFDWTRQSWYWLAAAFVWWALLVVTGWLTFLPGFSEHLKFTNGLVAHAHLAMAGLVTSMNFIILSSLLPDTKKQGSLTGYFVVWQIACVVHVAVLLAGGWFELGRAGEFFRGERWSQTIYLVRLIAGVVMWLVSLGWWRDSWRLNREGVIVQ